METSAIFEISTVLTPEAEMDELWKEQDEIKAKQAALKARAVEIRLALKALKEKLDG